MAIHWQIPFKSFRIGTDYRVNIYDDTYSDATPITLKGGAEPFTTDEDEDEDMFAWVRTQSGYIRIIDDNKGTKVINGTETEVDFNWKDIIPATDTSRPVTLTRKSGSTWEIVWQGFMQAQNFGGVLYGNPQEREFPVQCMLTVTQGTNINNTQTALQNFAYLLKKIVDSIPAGFRPSQFVIQGGAHAQQWLLKKIDWLVYSNINDEDELEPAYNMFECLEDMCRYWGWTARTNGDVMYLICADDSIETTFLKLTYAQLGEMAGGSTVGTINDAFNNIYINGDVFVSVNNNDTILRGYKKAVVKANAGVGNTDINLENDKLVELLTDQGWQVPFLNENEESVFITNDLASFSQSMMIGTSRSSYGSFALMSIVSRGTERSDGNKSTLIRIKKTAENPSYVTTTQASVSIQTVYEHAFSDGYIELNADIYRKGNKLATYENGAEGTTTMWMRIGIGSDRDHAQWWNEGAEWGSGFPRAVECYIGNIDNVLRIRTPYEQSSWITKIPVASAVAGKLFIEFLGSSNLEDIDGQKAFDICDFNLKFTRNENFLDIYKLTKDERKNEREYISTNNNISANNEWNNDMIFASDNYMRFGYGVIINANGGYFKGFQYVEHGPLVFPEQHLADRVANFWSKSKRKIYAELRSNAYIGALIRDINPRNKASIDDTTMYPISISHDWRDDVTRLTLIEL